MATQYYDELSPDLKDVSSPMIPLETSQYVNLVQRFLANCISPTLVVDALDECRDASNFIEWLTILTSRASNLNLIVASRYEPELEIYLTKRVEYQVSLGENMQPDIDIYIQNELRRRVTSRAIKFREPGLDDKILSAIKEKTHGM